MFVAKVQVWSDSLLENGPSSLKIVIVQSEPLAISHSCLSLSNTILSINQFGTLCMKQYQFIKFRTVECGVCIVSHLMMYLWLLYD